MTEWYNNIDISDVWKEVHSPSHPNDVLTYTNLERVSRRLNGKLKLFYTDEVVSNTVNINWTSEPEDEVISYRDYLQFDEQPGTEQIPTLSDDVISIELFVEIALAKEAYLNSILSQIYVMPLQNRHRMLGDICDNLVIAELMYVNANVLNENDSFQQRAVNYANNQINLLIAGYDIQLPYTVNPNIYTNRSGSYPNRFHLEGERLKIEPPKRRITNYYFEIEKWEDTSDSYNDFYIDNK